MTLINNVVWFLLCVSGLWIIVALIGGLIYNIRSKK